MSVLATFRNLKLSIFFAAVLLLFIALFSFNIDFDYKKITMADTMNQQSAETVKFDSALGEISKQLLTEHQHYMKVNLQEIQNLLNKDFVAATLFKDRNEFNALTKLQATMNRLHINTSNYYATASKTVLNMVYQNQTELSHDITNYKNVIRENIKRKNSFALYLEVAALIDLLFMFLWYSYKLSIIKKDLKLILDVDEEDRNKTFKTTEFTAIKRRMERRPMSSGASKNLLDPLTELLNEKGILSEYAQRGSTGKGYVFVTILDIDAFKELASQYGKTFTDTVIKKIAFMLNLEKKSSDIVGRTAEDQFILITPRETQSSAFEFVDRIRSAIEKTKFKAGSEKISVTVSGGFALKDKHEKIESAITTANSLVKRAKVQGKNSIAKPQGFSNDYNSRM